MVEKNIETVVGESLKSEKTFSNPMEQSLLGSIMLNPESMFVVEDYHVTSDDFYFYNNKKIFEAIQYLHSNNKPVDALAIIDKLKTQEILEKVGGKEYVIGIGDVVSSSFNLKYYIEQIKQKSTRRKIIKIAEVITQLGYSSDDIDSGTLLEKADSLLYTLFTEDKLTFGYAKIGDNLKDAFQRIDELSNDEEQLRGIRTGFNSLDRFLSGFKNLT